MKSIILFALCSLFLMSCGHHRDGTSVWAGGLWIAPWLTGIGGVIFLVAAYFSSRSGSNKLTPSGGKTNEEGGKVPIYQLGFFKFFILLAVVTIAIIIAVNADK